MNMGGSKRIASHLSALSSVFILWVWRWLLGRDSQWYFVSIKSGVPSRCFGLPMFNPESLHNPYITCSEPAHKRTQRLHGKTIILKVEVGANITEEGKVPYNQR